MGAVGKDPAALTQRMVEALLVGLLVSDRQELIRRVEAQRLTADSDIHAVGSDWGNGWNAAADELITAIRKMPLPGDAVWPSCEDVDLDEGSPRLQVDQLQQQYSALEHEVAELRRRIGQLEEDAAMHRGAWERFGAALDRDRPLGSSGAGVGD